jgi:hypothetical protein
MRVFRSIAILLTLPACGGGSGSSGEPLIATTLVGDFEGTSFAPEFGFAILYMGEAIMGVGTDPIDCGSPQWSEPPTGHFALVALPSFDVGSYSNVFVDVMRNTDGSFRGRGSNVGTVEITASTDSSLTGTVSYSDSIDSLTYGLSGGFEVVRCPD